jgi:hypothetical protein
VRRINALACLVLAPGSWAVAQGQSLEETLKACAAETNDQRRLACYDRSMGTQVTPKAKAAPTPAAGAPAPGPPPASATGAVAPASEFGVRNGPLDTRRVETGPKEITAAVTRLDVRRSGQLVVVLDNGQSWMQNEPGELALKIGDTVRIRTAALGSYMLLTPTQRFTHVTRIH